MHELAIAELVAGVALEHAAGRRVRQVRMRIGHLRQVVPDSLAFGFELVTRGTPLEGAALEIEPVPVVGRCRRCDAESEQAGFPFRCPQCDGYDVRVVRGEELQVESLELEDEPRPECGRAAGSTRGEVTV